MKSVDDDEIIVEYGNPVEKILTVSEEKKCDLIVMGTHGTGSIMDAMMGSTTTRVLRRSKIPVMVIRLPEYIRKRFLSKVLSTIDIQKERYKTPFDYSQCARCGINVADRLCQKVDGKFPNGCPTNNSTQVIKAALDEMQKSGAFDFARQSTIQEGEGYGDRELGYARVRPIKSRIEETIEFSTRMNYRRLGLAFCLGLRKEARVVDKLLTKAGFEVVSAMCKIGRIDKNYIGVRDDQKIRLCGLEPMCNPIAQAFVLNEAQTDFNITVGLCVGHDSLFLKYSEALCTVFAVKDRVLGHNPLAAIYTLDSYYRVLK